MICPLFCLRAMNAFLTKKHNPTIKNHIKPHKRLDIHKKPHYNNIKVGWMCWKMLFYMTFWGCKNEKL